MKILGLTVVALLAAGPAMAAKPISDAEAMRVALERGDAWHVAHLGPVESKAFTDFTTPPTVLYDGPGAPPLSAVPEPASWAMMLGGFAFIGGALRRRNMARVAA